MTHTMFTVRPAAVGEWPQRRRCTASPDARSVKCVGVVIGTSLEWPTWATLVLAIALAFVFGYAFTLRSVLGSGLDLRAALRVALAADTLSIAVMELVDNAVLVAVPGAMEAGLADAFFWLTLAGALGVAFVVTWPVNAWMIARGRGHVVVHRLH